MMRFEAITDDLLEIAVDIVNSNRIYNEMENGNPVRSVDEVSRELLNAVTESYLIKLNGDYVGLIDFLPRNPNDQVPWIGLLMIHHHFHSCGYGRKAYFAFEDVLRKRGFLEVRIGVLQVNKIAIEFWESIGFTFYGNSSWEGKKVDCFQKRLEG